MQRPGCSQHAAHPRVNRSVPLPRWLKSPLLGAYPKGPTLHLRSAAQPAGASASPEPQPGTTSSKRASTPRSTGAVLSQLLPPPAARELLASTWGLLRSSFWPVLLIYAMKDAVAFLLHRLGHRLTNLIAEATLGIPLSSITNPWWLHLDSRFLDGNIGYQVVIGFVFLVCLPLNILLNSYALATTMQVVKGRTGQAAAAAAQPPPSTSASPPLGRPATSADSQGEASTSNRSSGQVAGTASGPADTSPFPPSSALGASAVVPAPQQATAPPSSTPITVAPPTASTSAPTPSPSAGTSGPDIAGPGSERPAASGISHQGTTWLERAASVLGLRSAPESESAPASSPKEESGAATAAGPAVVTLSSVDSQSSLDAEVAAQSPQKPGMWQQLRAAWSDVWAAVPQVHAMLWRVWVADLRFNLQAMPLQGLSLLVLPMPWTLPRLLSIQVTVPSAIAEGLDGAAAMQRSSALMQGFRRAYAWPFTALILSIRLLDMARALLLTLVPPRWWQEIVELPVALIVAFGFAKIVIIRLQDIMPAAAYLSLVSPLRPATPQGSEPGSEEGEEQQPLLSQAPSL